MKIVIGRWGDSEELDLDLNESIQFVDLPGSPRLSVTSRNMLEISYDTGIGGVCVLPRASNVVEVGVGLKQ